MSPDHDAFRHSRTAHLITSVLLCSLGGRFNNLVDSDMSVVVKTTDEGQR